MRVLVVGSDPIHLRAAAALAAHPDIAVVGLADAKPPASWKGRMIAARTTNGFDVVVGGSRPGVRSVTADHTGTVSMASPVGLVRALATRLPETTGLAVTTPGKPSRAAGHADFPAPVGRVTGVIEDNHVMVCPSQSELTAVMARTDHRILAVLDHRDFLEAVTLAAGVFLRSGPVWEQAEVYLAACETMGLVIAEA